LNDIANPLIFASLNREKIKKNAPMKLGRKCCQVGVGRGISRATAIRVTTDRAINNGFNTDNDTELAGVFGDSVTTCNGIPVWLDIWYDPNSLTAWLNLDNSKVAVCSIVADPDCREMSTDWMPCNDDNFSVIVLTQPIHVMPLTE